MSLDAYKKPLDTHVKMIGRTIIKNACTWYPMKSFNLFMWTLERLNLINYCYDIDHDRYMHLDERLSEYIQRRRKSTRPSHKKTVPNKPRKENLLW